MMELDKVKEVMRVIDDAGLEEIKELYRTTGNEDLKPFYWCACVEQAKRAKRKMETLWS